MAKEDLSSLRVTRSRSSIRNLVLPYAEPEREMRKLREPLSTPEPSSIAINFDEALSEEDSDNHLTPSSPQSNNDLSILETITPKRLKDYSSPNPRGFSNAIVFLNEHTDEVLHASDFGLFKVCASFTGYIMMTRFNTSGTS
jgi:hypothetical protein